MTQSQVCADLGVSKSALQAWVNAARLHHHGFEPVEGMQGRAEQAEMRRIRELEQENEILRQAHRQEAGSAGL